jgi:UDP-2,3-diacylglucosamine pyrophosphatase LpxH
VPRFCIWCGTTRTRDWHRRFRAAAVVFGHLHIPQQRMIDEVRFSEVSLGYPRQWSRSPARIRPRQILPLGPAPHTP